MTEERIRELTKAMLRKKLYVVLSKGGAAADAVGVPLWAASSADCSEAR